MPLPPDLRTLRVLLADLHGVARGKDLDRAAATSALEHGVTFAAAVMATTLRGEPVDPGDGAFPDLRARLDLDTLAPVPGEPGVHACLATLVDAGATVPDPRGVVEAAAGALAAQGLRACIGVELELALLVRDAGAPGGLRPWDARPGLVHAVGPWADPGGVLAGVREDLRAVGVAVAAASRELGAGQHELALPPLPPRAAADAAFRARALTKDRAATAGALATFVGRPRTGAPGSGLHLHVSLAPAGTDVAAPAAAGGPATAAQAAFLAGVLAHAPGLAALLNPTVNAYRRTLAGSLAPTHACWGRDHRAVHVRVPAGGPARLEVRAADGAANPYLAIAGVLAAGADGVGRGLRPPPPVRGAVAEAPPQARGAALPVRLEDALDALEADAVLLRALGPAAPALVALKRDEVARHRAWVSDWDRDEYLELL